MTGLTYTDFLIKKKNGKNRKISAPSEELLKYQRKILPILEKYHRRLVAEHDLEGIQHGFIKGKNCVTACEKHIGIKYKIFMDLSNFFDSCNIYMFEKKITKFKYLFHEQGHCAQGFATSPMLANIASIGFIKQVKEKLELLHPSDKEMDNYSKQYAFTIYADDIQISTNNKELIPHIIKTVNDLAEKHRFSINKNKTRVRSLKFGFVSMLGINIGQNEIRATRKIMRKIRAADHQGNYHSKGGLTAWSKCAKPKKKEKQKKI